MNAILKLQIHIERPKLFKCEQCVQSFHRRNSLNRHVRRIHLNIRPRNCSYPRLIDFQRYKRREIREVISPLRQRWVTCHRCNKKLRDPFRLPLHLAQNCPAEIVYECDMCSRQMVWKRLISHFAYFHRVDGLKKWSCNQCDKRFMHPHLLSTHLRVHARKLKKHKKYGCQYCGRVFRKYKHHYDQHIEKCDYREYFTDDPIADEPFKCDICERAFLRKCGIVEHMRIMHSERSFSGVRFLKRFNCKVNRKVLQHYACCDEYYANMSPNPKHVTKHEKCKFYCKRCDSLFVDFYSLLRHSAEHILRAHQSIRHMEQCKSCSRMFKWRRSVPERFRSVKYYNGVKRMSL